MNTKFLIVLGVVILGLGGLFVFSKDDTPSGSGGATGQTSNHSIGGNSNNVEIIEYGDFQCPACAAFHPIVNAIQDKYKDDIKWTFRHFPLEQIHQNARAAHRTAEAAGKQGKFFEMYNKLYDTQNMWENAPDPRSMFQDYAQQLGLNLEQFNTDYASETVNSTINADKSAGTSQGVEGTPTFFINGQKVNNNDIQSLEEFSKKIDEAIQSGNN